MTDRQPLYPGRVVLTPVEGMENTYTLVRADEPEEEGTPLNKKTFMEDVVAELFGLAGEEAVPSKALEILGQRAQAGFGKVPLDSISVLSFDASRVAFGHAVDDYCASWGDTQQTRLISFRDYPVLGGNAYSGLLFYNTFDYIAILGWSYNGQVALKVKQANRWYAWYTWASSLTKLWDEEFDVIIRDGWSLTREQVDNLVAIEIDYSDGYTATFKGTALEPLKNYDAGFAVIEHTSPSGQRYTVDFEILGDSWHKYWYADMPMAQKVRIYYKDGYGGAN